MTINEGLYTRKVASEVGALLKYLMEHPEESEAFSVALVRYEPNGTQVDLNVFIRPVEDVTRRVVELANGSELIHCVTNDGRRIDFIFSSRVNERDLEPAMVVLESAAA